MAVRARMLRAAGVAAVMVGMLCGRLWGVDVVMDVSAVATTQEGAKLTLSWTTVRDAGTTFESHTVYRKALGAKLLQEGFAPELRQGVPGLTGPFLRYRGACARTAPAYWA